MQAATPTLVSRKRTLLAQHASSTCRPPRVETRPGDRLRFTAASLRPVCAHRERFRPRALTSRRWKEAPAMHQALDAIARREARQQHLNVPCALPDLHVYAQAAPQCTSMPVVVLSMSQSTAAGRVRGRSSVRGSSVRVVVTGRSGRRRGARASLEANRRDGMRRSRGARPWPASGRRRRDQGDVVTAVPGGLVERPSAGDDHEARGSVGREDVGRQRALGRHPPLGQHGRPRPAAGVRDLRPGGRARSGAITAGAAAMRDPPDVRLGTARRTSAGCRVPPPGRRATAS